MLGDPLALLNDHAHLEREAANNALHLVRRWPDGPPPHRWVERLTSIARDEVDHLGLVHRCLGERGGHLSRGFRNPYAGALRRLVRAGAGPDEQVDRLLVSALIEVRSCERFDLLASTDHELAPLYEGLRASEQGHFRVFVQLAETVRGSEEVAARWEALLDLEGEVAAAQPPGPRIHSGPPPG